MIRWLVRTYTRIDLRKHEGLDDRARRVGTIKKARFAVIGFAFSLGVAVSVALFSIERTAGTQTLFVVAWLAFASASLGAQLLVWSSVVRPGHREGIRNGEIVHLPSRFTPMLAFLSYLTLRVLAALLFVGFVGAVFWTGYTALKPPTEAPTVVSEAPPRPAPPPSSTISGEVTHIVDGDTFDIRTIRIRPLGFDTPEQGAQCEGGAVDVYADAKKALTDLVVGEALTCVDTGKRDRDGRTIAVCKVGDQEIGDYMVAQGWARDWPEYSGGSYCPRELEARVGKRGIWGLSCPADLWGKKGEPRDYRDPPDTGKECGQ